MRIPFHAGLDGSRPVFLVLQVVGAVTAVAVLAELTVGKTLAVSERQKIWNDGLNLSYC